jgi:hypothetical protein
MAFPHVSIRLKAGAGFRVLVGLCTMAGVAFAYAQGHEPPKPADPAYRSILDGPVDLTLPKPGTSPEVDSRHILQDLLTRAGLRPHFDLHRLSWGQARQINAQMPIAAPQDVAKPFILDVRTPEGAQALQCLTQVAYFETGNAGPDAQAAVVQVALNRTRHAGFPKSVCGVVYQGDTAQSLKDKAGCQFSFTCDGSLKRRIDAAEWQQARRTALRALSGYVEPKVGAATFYHADYVVPAWAPTLVKTATVGPHIFYRLSGEAGGAAALTAQYAGGEVKVAHEILAAESALTHKALKLDAAAKSAKARPTDGRVHLQLASSEPETDIHAPVNRVQPITPLPAQAPAG